MFWNLLAKFLAHPVVFEYLIKKGMSRPYTHIRSTLHTVTYMYRYWLFNPYMETSMKVALKAAGKRVPWSFPISIRVHHIMREDVDHHLHDHPWDARTFILKGWYREARQEDPGNPFNPATVKFTRYAGQTAKLKYKEYHKITEVSEGGVWTLFVTYRYQGVWGYLVNGAKVPYYVYNKEKLPEV